MESVSTYLHRVRRALLVASAVAGMASGACVEHDVAATVNSYELVRGEALAGQDGYTPYNFSWVVPGALSGLGYPGSGAKLEMTLGYLSARGVDLVVALTESTIVTDEMGADHGFDVLRLPVKDFTPPTMEQMDAFVAAARQELADGNQVAVHCIGGKGRTGTMLSAWFIAEGMSATDAIAHVRALRPGSVETSTQVTALQAYAELVHGQR